MFKRIVNEIDSVFARDPAARSRLEIILCYPGVHAIIFYRLSHWLWKKDFKLTARFLSTIGRFLTGIEIHPAARIGRRFFIDHGMGVVIGETAEVGDDVTLYQGVTLGGTSLGGEKRHPTLGNDVVVGANASVLGAIVLGNGVRVGAGSVVVRDVPANSTVVGIPARVVLQIGKPLTSAASQTLVDMPDPTGAIIQQLAERIELLEKKLAEIGLPTQPARAPAVNSAIFDDVSPSI